MSKKLEECLNVRGLYNSVRDWANCLEAWARGELDAALHERARVEKIRICRSLAKSMRETAEFLADIE